MQSYKSEKPSITRDINGLGECRVSFDYIAGTITFRTNERVGRYMYSLFANRLHQYSYISEDHYQIEGEMPDKVLSDVPELLDYFLN